MSRIAVLLFIVALLGVAAWFYQGRPDVYAIDGGQAQAGTADQQPLATSDSHRNADASAKMAEGAPGIESAQVPSENSPPAAASDCEQAQALDLAEIINGADTEALEREYEERRQSASERLSVSTESEHLLVAAMQEEDPATRLQHIERALEVSPDSAVILWTAAHICIRAQQQQACPLDDWLARLLEVDSGNTEAWMLAATSRYKDGDHEAALDALRQAANAPETSIFWADVVEMTERSLAAAGDMPFPERVNMAFGTAAGGGPNYMLSTSMCEERSAADSEWASLCFAYGERVEQQSRTALGTAIARATQANALRAMGEEEKLNAVNARREEYRRKRQENTDFLPGIHMLSPVLFHTYLDAIRRVGEDQAQEILMAEARRLFSGQSSAGCEDD